MLAPILVSFGNIELQIQWNRCVRSERHKFYSWVTDGGAFFELRQHVAKPGIVALVDR